MEEASDRLKSSSDTVSVDAKQKFAVANDRIDTALVHLKEAVERVNLTLNPVLAPDNAATLVKGDDNVPTPIVTGFDQLINDTESRINYIVETLDRMCERSAV